MTWLDSLLSGYTIVESNGTALPKESAINFLNATVVDNPGNTSTDVTIPGTLLQGRTVSATAPTAGQVLLWNNTLMQWQPGPAGGGSLSPPVTIIGTTDTTQLTVEGAPTQTTPLVAFTDNSHNIGTLFLNDGTVQSHAFDSVISSGTIDVGPLNAHTVRFFNGIAGNSSAITINGAVQSASTGTNSLQVRAIIGQTGDLQQWQDLSNNPLARVTSAGTLEATQIDAMTSGGNVNIGSTNAADVLVGKAVGGIIDLLSPVNTHQSIFNVGTISSTDTVSINEISPGNVPLLVNGAASQSAHLQDWRTNSATILAHVDASGNFFTPAIDQQAAGTLAIGTSTATAINVSRSGVLTTNFGNYTVNGASQALGTLIVQSNATGNIPLQIRNINSQTVDNCQFQDFTNSPIAKVTNTGTWLGPGIDSIAPGSFLICTSNAITIFIGSVNASINVNSPIIQFGPAVVSPIIQQNITTSGTGQNLLLKAQNTSSAAGNAGKLILHGGDTAAIGTTTGGSVQIAPGRQGSALTVPNIESTEVIISGTPSRITALNLMSTFGATQVGTSNAVDGVTFIANSVTSPTAGNATKPSGGGFMYAEAGALKWKSGGTNGTITTMGPAEPHCPKCGRDFAHEWQSDNDHVAICAPCMLSTLETAGIDVSQFAFIRKLG